MFLPLIFGPGVVAVLAVYGAVGLFMKLRTPGATRFQRVVYWIGIGLLGAIAFGIGCCYTAIFASSVWLH